MKQVKREFLQEAKNSPLPAHAGYHQLCIILGHQKNFDEAIRLASVANDEGWTGNRDAVIEHCIRKKEV